MNWGLILVDLKKRGAATCLIPLELMSMGH